MVIDFFEEHTKVRATIDDTLREHASLKSRQKKLGDRLLTLAIGRRFQQGGVTRSRSGWYVGDDGKLARDS